MSDITWMPPRRLDKHHEALRHENQRKVYLSFIEHTYANTSWVDVICDTSIIGCGQYIACTSTVILHSRDYARVIDQARQQNLPVVIVKPRQIKRTTLLSNKVSSSGKFDNKLFAIVPKTDPGHKMLRYESLSLSYQEAIQLVNKPFNGLPTAIRGFGDNVTEEDLVQFVLSQSNHRD